MAEGARWSCVTAELPGPARVGVYSLERKKVASRRNNSDIDHFGIDADGAAPNPTAAYPIDIELASWAWRKQGDLVAQLLNDGQHAGIDRGGGWRELKWPLPVSAADPVDVDRPVGKGHECVPLRVALLVHSDLSARPGGWGLCNGRRRTLSLATAEDKHRGKPALCIDKEGRYEVG